MSGGSVGVSEREEHCVRLKLIGVRVAWRKCWCKWRGGVLCSFEADQRKSGVEVGVAICEHRSERKKLD